MAATNIRQAPRTPASVVKEPFFLQEREIGVRNRKVVLADVAALREDLRQVGQVVLLEEAFGEFRLFTLGPQLVDFGSISPVLAVKSYFRGNT